MNQGSFVLPKYAATAVAVTFIANFANAWSIETVIVNFIKNSQIIVDLHQEHVQAQEVRHMMKSTPLVNAPDEDKIKFAKGPFGRMVADIMAAEQELLGEWKIEKIVDASGDSFDEEAAHQYLIDILDQAPITIFSFVDCPWCLLAKRLLQEQPYNYRNGDGVLQIIELEDLGRKGKELRAAIALATGRTSMPACFFNKRSIGGYTDGFTLNGDESDNEQMSRFVPDPSKDLRNTSSRGLAHLAESGELTALLRNIKETNVYLGT